MIDYLIIENVLNTFIVVIILIQIKVWYIIYMLLHKKKFFFKRFSLDIIH